MTATFPSAVVTDAQLKVASNRRQTVLRGTISASDTVITVADASWIVANMLLTIDSEIISVTSVSGNNLTVVRGFDSTTAAAHSSGRTVSHNWTAWHHNAMAAEVKAIETALGANLANVGGSGIGGGVLATAYNFAAQTPGGSLIVGANVITLSPVPLGINGSNTNHYVYISGGTGAAEAALITGGTAVSGAASGTIIVTVANTHSGAWTVRSATAGLQEAAWIAAEGGAIAVPSGIYDTYQVFRTRLNQTVLGAGSNQTIIRRNHTAGHTVFLNGSTAGAGIRGCQLTTAVTVTSGAHLYVLGGDPVIDDVMTNGGYDGVTLDSAPRPRISNLVQLNFENRGLSIGTAAGTAGPLITNHVISATATNAVGLYCYGGLVTLTNFNYQLTGTGSRAIFFDPPAATLFGESSMSTGVIDSADIGIFRSSSAGDVRAITFSNITMVGSSISDSAIWFGDGPTSSLALDNIIALNFASANGVVMLAGASNVVLSNVSVQNCRAASVGLNLGITALTAKRIKVINSSFGYNSDGTVDANMTTGLVIGSISGTENIHIQGTALQGSTAGISVGALAAGVYLVDNRITGAKPTAAANVRQSRWYTEGGAGVADLFEVARKDAADVYAWTALF